MNENNLLSVNQAYRVMFVFLRAYYYRKGKPDELGSLLGDIHLLDDNKPADPAMWKDWQDAIEQVLSSDEKARF